MNTTSETEVLNAYNSKTILRTIRIPRDVAEVLEHVAERQGITFNALANKVLKKHAEFDQFAEKLGFASLPRETLRPIIQSLDDSALEAIADALGQRVPSETMLYFFKQLNLPNFLRFLELLANYYRIGVLEFGWNDKGSIVVFHHDMGRKWSVFWGHYLTQGAKRIIGTSPAFEVAENLIVLSFQGMTKSELHGTG